MFVFFPAINPKEGYVVVGTNLYFTCTCPSESPECFSVDILWKRFSTVISENVTLVNQTTSQLSLYDLQFEDTGSYKCCLKDTANCSELVMVRVGGK